MEKALIVVGYKTVNYGAAVQAVATQRLFEKVGLRAEVLNLEKLWSVIRQKKVHFYLANLQLSYIFHSKGKLYFSRVIRKFNRKYDMACDMRYKEFESFLKKNLSLTRVIDDFNDAKIIAENYEYVILGSDQVWLPSSVLTNVYDLSFAWDLERVKKVCYAPSFGVDYILPRYKNVYSNMLRNIDCISVREEAGVRLVNDLVGITPPMVADPVLMLNKQEWESIIPNEDIPEINYVFIYFLGNNKLHRRRAVEYAKKRGLTTVGLIHLDEYIKEDEKIYDKFYVSLSPGMFVNYIRNANVIFTDSYHCFLLSLIHHKKVGLYMRYSDKSTISTNNRLYSIMRRLNLKHGIIDEKKEIKTEDLISDYEVVDNKIEDFRKSSYQFIDHVIKKGLENDTFGERNNTCF
ncbi:polysaccharide pyruvyl transferase family protein [Butyrivibrio sp. NC2002]|uniref:polysaccharide pyruvyl transferase family protein n=1 Tax=Butyrivibrio sp. NC2002 TaxID=1410610 RepID=UPI0005661FD1|nr:polysaccharide pyruvyl transferase family protein [Butyrivibrio sp. NC2002]